MSPVSFMQCSSPSLQLGTSPYRVNQNHSPQNHDTEQLKSRHRLHSIFGLFHSITAHLKEPNDVHIMRLQHKQNTV